MNFPSKTLDVHTDGHQMLKSYKVLCFISSDKGSWGQALLLLSQAPSLDEAFCFMGEVVEKGTCSSRQDCVLKGHQPHL